MRVGVFAASGAAALSGPALLLGVPQRLALGAPSHRRGIRLHTVRRRAQPDLFRQLGCLEADFNGHGGLDFPVVKSGDSGYPVAPRLKIPFGRFPRSSLSLSRPLPTLSPSLIGHLASVNVKQH